MSARVTDQWSDMEARTVANEARAAGSCDVDHRWLADQCADTHVLLANVRRLVRERDDARMLATDNAHDWAKAQDEANRLRAEVERLGQEISGMQEVDQKQRWAAETSRAALAERDMLRSGLRYIAACAAYVTDPLGFPGWVKTHAELVLAGKEIAKPLPRQGSG